MSKVQDRLVTALQYCIPQHAFSRLFGKIANSTSEYIKSPLIKWWTKKYQVSLKDCIVNDVNKFITFNDFFTRKLKSEARPFPEDENVIMSPVDGGIAQIGDIESGRIIQAKGFDFSVNELIGADELLAKKFASGKFATLYLSPSDYHRVHMPCNGKLIKMIHIPGKLFSVNKAARDQVPRVFARNERVACVFETAYGPMVMILVGAMFVAGIETAWSGQVTPVTKKISVQNYVDPKSIDLARGDEMGLFKLGSTVIVLFTKDAVSWKENCIRDTKIKLGQTLALA